MEKYKDAKAPIPERVEDLLSRMTLEQKIAQLQCTLATGSDPAKALAKFPQGIGEVATFSSLDSPERMIEFNRKVVDILSKNPLGIPPIIHVEALTGVNSPGSTIFPSAIALGATFSPDTVLEMARIIRKQMVSVGYRQALSPVMDVARDPRWGRVGETYGEDPTLNAAMSVAFTRGLQGDDLSQGAVVTGKHFLGYSVSDGGLNMASNPLTKRELREVYAKPFQAAITEGRLQSVMNSYGTIDNDMVIQSREILTGLLRGEMGFEGILVSDYMSIDRLINHRMAKGFRDAGVKALKAGLDVECPVPQAYTAELAAAVRAGEVDEALVDRSVRRVLETKFKLGLFENPYPFAELAEEAYRNPAYRAHSLKAARESIVLLKNDGLLPLSRDLKTIALVGPHADSLRLLFGCYTFPASIEMSLGRAMGDMAGMADTMPDNPMADALGGPPQDDGFVQSQPMPGCEVLREHPDVTRAIQAQFGEKTPTILAAIKAKCPNARVLYAEGCEVAGTDRSKFAEALEAARQADVVIMTLGGKYGWGLNCTIGEGIDCDDIGLGGVQEELAREIAALGKPTVLVHMDARPLSSPWAQENLNAILENWYPGITGGEALADVLFGDYNPAGRMPITAPRSAGQIPVYTGQKAGNSYYTQKIRGVLSRYAEGTPRPLYYFGEGQSYTQFEYRDLQVSPKVSTGGTVEISCTVKNTGNRDGEEVVQLYVVDELASMLRPYKEFAGAKRLPLKAGESRRLRFTLRPSQFAFLNQDMKWVVEEGDMTVLVGASSEDIRLTGAFRIENSAEIEGPKRGFYAQAEVL
ncbi:MAG: glycoside hydrolase family 3 C-terminal domain-containing protein [Treponema sp.]|jgi:beta-glucosidase|nr:glycoside hydrolase family 3 C-terminal domain-containing protein [Treponema sp.]